MNVDKPRLNAQIVQIGIHVGLKNYLYPDDSFENLEHK
tara:strand:- start:6318 stop:6431 length:114 start_codon:yes stop_codon:yes gene_type:complete